jgi:uncharacterized phage-associated protein
MAYEAKAVANHFLDLAAENNTSLTPMKLQKLVFFAHGWHLGLYGEPLIADPIQAWKFGPVVPALYHEFKHVGAGAIAGKATDFDFANGTLVQPTVEKEDMRSLHLLDQVWKIYAPLSGVALSNLTHLPSTPWDKAWSASGGAMNTVISEEDIKQYFEAEAAKSKAKSSSNDATQ